MTAAWAVHELGQAVLGDPRRTRRAAQVLSDLAERPGSSIPAACVSEAATKAAYRLLENAAVEPAAILASHVAATTARLHDIPRILALQDTTELNFTAHPALAGAGPLSRPRQTGLLVHSVLAVTPAGVPLGLLDQQVWTRDPTTRGRRHTRRERETADKESGRWLAAQTATAAAVPPQIPVLTVADREADIFDLFAQARPPHHALLLRAAHNRRIDEEARYLWAAVEATPVGAVAPVLVGRRGDRDPAEVLLSLRWTRVTLRPPRHHLKRAAMAPVVVSAILAEERGVVPASQGAIRWLLLTTLPVPDAEAALAGVRTYALRWRIERYHYVLKEGLRIEERQLRTVDRVERLLALCAIVAWRLLWLTYLAREAPEAPVTGILTDAEWQVLALATRPGQPPPTTPPTLHAALRQIAHLGGFLGRTGDGEPGVKVLWRGWQRLQDLVVGWQLAQASPPPSRLVGNA